MKRTIHHRTAHVGGYELFYREAGPSEAPVVVLLHGFPTDSSMFRNLIPILAERYHVIAPDYLGFGHSATPSAEEFDYTFDALADHTSDLLMKLGVEQFTMYVQDYGAPVGWRLALKNPEAITGIISQNGNAYEDGFVPDFWSTVWAYDREQNPETEQAIRSALSLDAIKWQYLTGVPDQSLIDPDRWVHDYNMVSRPGNDRVQLDLVLNYSTNLEVYPKLHRYFVESQVPLLAVWGRGDEIFAPAGAEAFRKDLPKAQVHLIDGGHFLLESALEDVAPLIESFLAEFVEGSN